MWTLHIPKALHSANDRVINRSSRNAAARQAFAAMGRRYRAERDTWVLLIRNAMQMAKVPPARMRRMVRITRLFAGREREWDYGNLVGGAKPAIDAMVIAGLLVDDSPKWSDQAYHQERGAESGVRLVVTDI